MFLNSKIAYSTLQVRTVQRFNWNGYGLIVVGRPRPVIVCLLASLSIGYAHRLPDIPATARPKVLSNHSESYCMLEVRTIISIFQPLLSYSLIITAIFVRMSSLNLFLRATPAFIPSSPHQCSRILCQAPQFFNVSLARHSPMQSKKTDPT